MSKKTLSWIIMIGGIVVIVFSLIADLIGLGSYPGINSAQLLGAAAGLIITILGYFSYKRKPESQE
jgi:uncharacterized membrane protein